VSRVARLLALVAAFALAAGPFAARGHGLAVALAAGDICTAGGGTSPAVPDDSHGSRCECCTSAHAPPPFVRPLVVASLGATPIHAPAIAPQRAFRPASFLARAPPSSLVVPS
jgi:hypothetical protein